MFSLYASLDYLPKTPGEFETFESKYYKKKEKEK